MSEQTLLSFQKAIASDPSHSYEIIVVDNASRDGVSELIEKQYPAVRLIRNISNLGFSKANNAGFETSQGTYILFSNPDIEIFDTTLPTLLSFMSEHPDVGACTPLLRLPSGALDWGSHRGWPTPWASFAYMIGLSRIFSFSKSLSKIFGQYHLLDKSLREIHEVDAIKGGFFFVRRDVFKEAGKWDEDYFLFGEDIDLCYKIKQKRHKIMFYPRAEAIHYQGITTGLKAHSRRLSVADEESKQRAYDAFYQSMKIFYDKHFKQKYHPFTRALIFAMIDLKHWWGRNLKRV